LPSCCSSSVTRHTHPSHASLTRHTPHSPVTRHTHPSHASLTLVDVATELVRRADLKFTQIRAPRPDGGCLRHRANADPHQHGARRLPLVQRVGSQVLAQGLPVRRGAGQATRDQVSGGQSRVAQARLVATCESGGPST